MVLLSTRLTGYIVAAAAFLGAFWALSLGIADGASRRPETAGLLLSKRIAPGDAVYQAQWSLLTENEEQATASLKKAAALNLYYSWAWSQLGLRAERVGQYQLAEQYLVRASQLDRRFTTRWTLCDFYFRRSRSDLFWHWAHEALKIRDGEPRLVFRLAWRMAPDAKTIMDRLLPDDRAKDEFLSFLLAEARLQAASAIPLLLPAAAPNQAPVVLSYCDEMIESGRVAEAVEIWNAACRRSLIPFPPLTPDAGVSLTNAHFLNSPSGHGFDWMWHQPSGVTMEPDTAPAELKLSLSGSQPDSFSILSQRVPVSAGTPYEIQFRSRVLSTRPQDGLRWRIRDGPTNLIADFRWPLSGDWTQNRFTFTSAGPLLTLSLDFERPRGATRLAGIGLMSGLTLQPAARP